MSNSRISKALEQVSQEERGKQFQASLETIANQEKTILGQAETIANQARMISDLREQVAGRDPMGVGRLAGSLRMLDKANQP